MYDVILSDWRYNMLVFKINLKNSATPQVHIYQYNLYMFL